VLVSRAIAKRRIARGDTPTWFAAWLPVVVDALIIAALMVALIGPFQALIGRFNFPLWATIAALFALAFIPIQGLLILSSLWAAKSRWQDKEDNT
jgi:hypothetical protein